MATFNLDGILEIAEVGVRRAATFIAIGLHGAKSADKSALFLESDFQIRFIPENVSDELLAGFKSEYSSWVIGNALRELDQSFSLFIDKLHALGLLIRRHKGDINELERQRLATRFVNDTNLSAKIGTFSSDYSCTLDCADHFAAISKARNCLSHAYGIVRKRDCNGDDYLKISWLGIDLVTTTTNASQSIPHHEFQPFTAEEDTGIGIRFAEREKQFSVKEKIILSEHDLSEMCLMFSSQAKSIIRQFADYCTAIGVQVAEPERN